MKNTYLRGELYYADLGTGIGSEQNGYRPVVIIQNDVGNRHSPTTIVAAISAQIKTQANLAHPLPFEAEKRTCAAFHSHAGANQNRGQNPTSSVHRKTA